MAHNSGFLKNRLYIVNIVTSLLLLIAAGSAFYFYRQYSKSLQSNRNVPEVETIAESVALLMELPAENPTLATVSDVEKLRDQEFFLRAKNGDKVLIFKNAKKAVLYRPLTNKIIEVGPIQVSDPQEVAGTATESAQIASATPSASVKPVRVAILNGTKVNGLSKKTADSLKIEFSDVVIQSTGNTTGDYNKNLVVDISKNQKKMAESVAKFLKAEVGGFPSGESTPDADLLIILGTQ